MHQTKPNGLSEKKTTKVHSIDDVFLQMFMFLASFILIILLFNIVVSIVFVQQFGIHKSLWKEKNSKNSCQRVAE